MTPGVEDRRRRPRSPATSSRARRSSPKPAAVAAERRAGQDRARNDVEPRLATGADGTERGRNATPTPALRSLVSIRDLSKYYVRGDQVIPVLVDIDLDVDAGDFVALMGPSGSGKSTLLNLIAGIDKPTSGEIRVARRRHRAAVRCASSPLARGARRLHLPVLQPDAGAHRVRERRAAAAADVALARASGASASRRRSRWSGLADRIDALPDELSGGQQQRVAIARAIVTDPTLIVADEPTGDLDRTTAEEILGLLERLNDELGKTIIMVTHDPQAAEQAHRLIHLEKGVLVD